EEVLAVLHHVARARPLQPVLVHAVAVDVAHHHAVAVLLRPRVAEIEDAAGVGVAPAGCVVLALAAARARPVAAAPVDVVGTALDQAVDVRVDVLAVHADVVGAGDDVEYVLDDAVGDEDLAVLVPVHAPGVGRARRDPFEGLVYGVEAP